MNKKTTTVEKQVKEFNYQLAITNRLKELNEFKINVEKELEQYHYSIQQKSAELNVILGAIGELELLLKLDK